MYNSDDIKSLYEKFKLVQQKGWIKSFKKGSCGVGHTFENEIGKPIECMELPDYKSIEIKTHKDNNSYPIGLFSALPSGNHEFETKYLVETYGKQNPNNKNCKSLRVVVNALNIKRISDRFIFKLEIDRTSKKIFLIVLDNELNIIDKSTYWNFDDLKIKLFRKMSTLALIEATSKFENYNVYFKYDKITFFYIKSFDSFINSIENGKIQMTLNIATYKRNDGSIGINNHGTTFRIHIPDLPSIYTKINIIT